MRAIGNSLPLLGGLLLCSALFPSPARAASKELEQILAELRQLQVQVAQLQRSQAEFERKLERLSVLLSDEDSSRRRAMVDTQTALDTIQEELSILSAKVDETNGRLGNLTQQVASMRQAQPIQIPPVAGSVPAGQDSEPSSSLPAGPTSSPSPPPGPVSLPASAAPPGPVELYNQAYTDYTHMRYPLAISGFKEVISRYPDSELADNGQYWIGECLLAQRKYKEALEAFDAVLSLYPNSNKLPEASYKKAIALEAMGSRADAIRQLELVIEQFPRTPVARVAKEKLSSMR